MSKENSDRSVSSTRLPLQRLMGLETEYAVSSDQESDFFTKVLTQRGAFAGIIGQLEKSIPCADADIAYSGKRGIFLATGGAVWFESLFPTTDVGLIEGATPECRGVKQTLACQRAQDELLFDAAQKIGARLLKNDSDGDDNSYGAQENFEVVFETGQKLRLFKYFAIVFLIPATVFLYAVALSAIAVMILMTVLTSLVYITKAMFQSMVSEPTKNQHSEFDFWIGRFYRGAGEEGDLPMGGWAARPTLWCLMIAAAPLSVLISLALLPTRIGRLHRDLAPFLATRLVLAGAGRIDKQNRFHLSDKAFSKRVIAGVPEFFQGFFSIGQFIKPCVTLVRFSEVWKERQRIQVAIGDSNMCEEAEYLRIGTTALVVDAMESGSFGKPIRIRRPVAALHRFDRDDSMEATAYVYGHGRATAIEIQRMYLERCRAYLRRVEAAVDKSNDDDLAASQEANGIVDRWEDVLEKLKTDPESLIGRVDWITKRFILDQIQPASYAAAKKIDLKYHQLGPEGYHSQFATTAYRIDVLVREMIDKAKRLPPPNSPAGRRAMRIREYSSTGEKVSWNTS